MAGDKATRELGYVYMDKRGVHIFSIGSLDYLRYLGGWGEEYDRIARENVRGEEVEGWPSTRLS